MMRSMNNKAFSFIFLGILVLAALSLVLTDWTGSFRSGVGSADIAKIGDDRVSQADFARIVERTLRAQQIPPQQAYQAGIITQILTTEVWQRMLGQAAHDYGIAVGDDLLVKKLADMAAPVAASEKTTPSVVVKRFIEAQNMSEGEFMNTMRRDIVNGMMRDLVTTGSGAPSPLMVADLVAQAGQKRNIDFILLRDDAVAGVTSPTDQELEAYYTGRKADFMLPERRDAQMIVIKRADLLKDVVVTDDDIQKFYTENKAIFPKDATLATLRPQITDRLKEDKGGEVIDAKLDALDKGHERGDTMDVVAKALNATPTTLAGIARDGTRADGTDALADMAAVKGVILGALFADGTVTSAASAPIELPNGDIAIVQVDKIVAATAKPMNDVRDQLVTDWLSDQRRMANIKAAQEFLPDLIAGKRSVQSLAHDKGVAVETVTEVTRDQKQLPTGLDRAAWQRLFDTSLMQPIFQPVPGGVMVAVVTSITMGDINNADLRKTVQEDLARAQHDEQMAQYLGALTDRYGTQINNKLIMQMYAPRAESGE